MSDFILFLMINIILLLSGLICVILVILYRIRTVRERRPLSIVNTIIEDPENEDIIPKEKDPENLV